MVHLNSELAEISTSSFNLFNLQANIFKKITNASETWSECCYWNLFISCIEILFPVGVMSMLQRLHVDGSLDKLEKYVDVWLHT